jgi:hypothetical protein
MGLVFTSKTMFFSNLLEEAIFLFNKKFRSFCEKSPLSLSYAVMPSYVLIILYQKKKEFQFKKPWEDLQKYMEVQIEEFTKTKGIEKSSSDLPLDIRSQIVEKAVKQFIYEIRLLLAPYRPVFLYRKYEWREKTPEEMIKTLVEKKEKGKNSEVETKVCELKKEKKFILEQVILPKSLFAFTDEEGYRYLYRLKTGLTMPFLYRLNNEELLPEELGKQFFSKAQLISKKGPDDSKE